MIYEPRYRFLTHNYQFVIRSHPTNNARNCAAEEAWLNKIEFNHVASIRIYVFIVVNFTFVWPCIVTNFFVIKPTRCTNFTNSFWHESLHVSDSSSFHHQEFIHCTLSNGMSYRFVDSFRAGPDSFRAGRGPARKLSTKLYDIYHCWVYSE